MSNRGCLIIALLVLACNVSAQTAAVEVHVHDQAGLKLWTFQRFVSQMQKILSETGLSIQVKACRRGFSAMCESQTGKTRYLVVRVIAGRPKKMKNVRRSPLGQAFTDDDGGKYASVFLERVQDEAASANVPWVIVLAYAAAHEVGHLLLGNQAHTLRGLMKGTWDRTDYEAMNQNYLHFSDEQVRQLKSRYGSGASGMNSQPLKLADGVEHE